MATPGDEAHRRRLALHRGLAAWVPTGMAASSDEHDRDADTTAPDGAGLAPARLASTCAGRREVPSNAPGILYGIGLGGLVDGILLHQLLQWHHVLSATERHPVTTVAGLNVNTMADGYFHVLTWFIVLGASIVTWAQWRQGRLAPRWDAHAGAALIGWGGFNLVEGLINHHLLGAHHVRDDLGGPLAWDLGFLAFGILLVLVGAVLLRRGRVSAGAQSDPFAR